MPDTISFTTSASLRQEFSDATRLPNGWTANACGTATNSPSTQKLDIVCVPIDLHLFGTPTRISAVRANLPKLIYGHNGRLITTEGTFTNAMGWLNYILHSVLVPLPPNSGIMPEDITRTPSCHYTRIDLPWHFPVTSGVVAALADARHDKIRSCPSLIKGQTVHLRGSFLEIVVYDKVRQMRLMDRIPNEVHRVEFRLKNKALSEIYRFFNGDGYTHLTYAWLRWAMRKVAEETHASIPPAGGGSIHHFIADLEASFPMVGALDRYVRSQDLTRESARKFRNRVQALRRPPQGSRAFADFFPSGDWAPPPEVELPEEEQQHYAWRQRYVGEMQSIPGGRA